MSYLRTKPRIPKVFKNVIAPIQAWLLSQGRCVGCGRELSNGKKEARRDGTQKVTCACGRIFIYDPQTKKYRRALLEEV
jgi:predicted  nucleic acid-binding Zn-ribbon protein